MVEPIDYSAFDRVEISQSMFYPQRLWSPAPETAVDHAIAVEDGITISARFYLQEPALPSILFFHGNGEVACQYDEVASFYHEAGASLVVADFRGYGLSGGSPSFSTMLSDACAIYEYFRDFLASMGHLGPRFVKGRSLGCHSAVEVAARYQSELNGLISESGSSSVNRMVRRWGLSMDSPVAQEVLRLHEDKVSSVKLPFLSIHGELDDLVPVETAVELYNNIGSDDKNIELISGAGHNDLLWIGRTQYFSAVKDFLNGHLK